MSLFIFFVIVYIIIFYRSLLSVSIIDSTTFHQTIYNIIVSDTLRKHGKGILNKRDLNIDS